ncbi:MAG TPA: TMEM175 family protein [Trebonia sp.]|nr:TMEM175 family protein [Trebonia sp.]
MDSGRLEAFSDGVFAVAITLLALNLSVVGPGRREPSLATQLGAHWPAFAAYAVSFAAIGIVWVNHHALFKSFSEIDRALLFLNLLLLFFVVAIPFATSTFADYLRQGGHDATLAAVLYQGVFVGMSLSFGGLLWWGVRRGHMKVAFTPRGGRRVLIRFGIGNVFYLAAIGIAFLSATASLIVSALVGIYYIGEQTPTGEAAIPATGTSPDSEADDSEGGTDAP